MIYIWLALFSALAFSISDITSKYLFNNGISNFQLIFWAHGILYIIFTLIGILITSLLSVGIFSNNKKFLDVIKLPSIKLSVALLFCSIVSFLGMLSLVYTFKKSKNIGLIVPLVGSTSLFTLILSRIIFKIKIPFIGLVGAILILTGVFCISKCPN